MPEVTGLLMAAALRPADVLGDHERAAGRSHSLPFAPPASLPPCRDHALSWYRRAAQYLYGKAQYLSGKRRTAMGGLIRRADVAVGATAGWRSARSEQRPGGGAFPVLARAGIRAHGIARTCSDS